MQITIAIKVRYYQQECTCLFDLVASGCVARCSLNTLRGVLTELIFVMAFSVR
ncbi:hypothetical protein T4A_133 [Trichinella pseudospiralis]|uniref:Uncharacterized protein n=1 Tax=Trichinella pseudospiralis TaxID=6337 RepID=A0A0V1E0G0_TRIPS|nr:hypothetical protein T4A_133 [Trichinella pseudospiralis]